MPEKDFITWQALTMMGAAIAGTFAFMLAIFKKPQPRGHTTESRVAVVEKELDEHKVNVAENYISRLTINAIIHAMEKNFETKLDKHTSDLKLAINEAVQRASKR